MTNLKKIVEVCVLSMLTCFALQPVSEASYENPLFYSFYYNVLTFKGFQIHSTFFYFS